jgi:hypothetical protein
MNERVDFQKRSGFYLKDAGLSDGIFSYKKSQFRYILEGLAVENFVLVIFYQHLLYLVITRNILWYFGILFPSFGMLHQDKSGNPGKKVMQMSDASIETKKTCTTS